MRQTIRLRLSFSSMLGSELHSDSIFGQFCWTWRDIHGDDSLTALLAQFPNRPPVVFSDGFPAGHLPKPELGPIEWSDSYKDFRKKKFVTTADFTSLAPKGRYSDWLRAALAVDSERTAVRRLSNTVSRLTGTVVAGSLYSFQTFHSRILGKEVLSLDQTAKYPEYDVYASIDAEISVEKVIEVVRIMGILGFGKDKNTGNGSFELSSNEVLPAMGNIRGNLVMSLSSCLPCEQLDLIRGEVFTKFPKHGHHLAMQGRHLKNPVVLFRPGAIFRTAAPREVYGRTVSLDPNLPEHLHNGMMIPVSLNVEEIA